MTLGKNLLFFIWAFALTIYALVLFWSNLARLYSYFVNNLYIVWFTHSELFDNETLIFYILTHYIEKQHFHKIFCCSKNNTRKCLFLVAHPCSFILLSQQVVHSIWNINDMPWLWCKWIYARCEVVWECTLVFP